MPRLVHLILNNIYIYSCFSFCLFVVLLMVVYSWYSLLLMLQSMPFVNLKPGDIKAIPFSRFYYFNHEAWKWRNNSSNNNSSSNGNNSNKYTRTPAITLSTAKIRAITTQTTPKTTTMTTVTVIIIKTITKTITQLIETLSTLTIIRVTDPVRNQSVIHLDLETLYLWKNLSIHDFFWQTPGSMCF